MRLTALIAGWLCKILKIDIQKEKNRQITERVMASLNTPEGEIPSLLKIEGSLTVIDANGNLK
jgi:hypothetical protein